MGLIDEKQEVCFGFLKAGRCKIGQDGIFVFEKMTLIRLCATSVKAGQANRKGFQVAETSCERFHLRRNLERRITSNGLVQILINDNNFAY